ncbi:hypothetical protein O3Q52_01690 [Streptomyces sp. ActVer]|uniref:hypothetical protein n=1 Tax=Streptomyces sp. ActVer TaxID=3014558 RepID=UPI0022B2EFC8|nr:hypothetical protein [Streptomyces sp. ActVer]MCZ4506940.1 hypothetical protein [Streptomyces sp. ActVer]
MAEQLERVTGFVDPKTGHSFATGPIAEVGRKNGQLYFVMQQHPDREGRAMDLHAWITGQVALTERLLDEKEWPPSQAEGVRLRCESDRRILAIHQAVSDGYSQPFCDGCGTAGICDDPVTENINDCPILLAIGHAHGLTPEILATLHRPQAPERPRAEPSVMGRAAAEVWGEQILASLRDVPAALRGPNWKAGDA